MRSCKYEVINNLNISKNCWHLGFTTCNRIDCIYCKHALVSTFYKVNGIYYRISKRITCNSRDSIYLIYCNTCKEFVYVGESSQFLRLRMSRHLSDISNKVDSPIGLHFNSTNHNINDFSFIGIDLCNNLYKRRILEAKYIKIIKPSLNINKVSTYSFIPKFIIPYSRYNRFLYYRFKSALTRYHIPVHSIYTKAHKGLKSHLHKKF